MGRFETRLAARLPHRLCSLLPLLIACLPLGGIGKPDAILGLFEGGPFKLEINLLHARLTHLPAWPYRFHFVGILEHRMKFLSPASEAGTAPTLESVP